MTKASFNMNLETLMQGDHLTTEKEKQIAKELKVANDLPSSYSWWGSDYDEHKDVLVLHAFSNLPKSRRKSAQMFFYKPHYLCRPALQVR